jgi:hypothetical protein
MPTFQPSPNKQLLTGLWPASQQGRKEEEKQAAAASGMAAESELGSPATAATPPPKRRKIEPPRRYYIFFPSPSPTRFFVIFDAIDPCSEPSDLVDARA